MYLALAAYLTYMINATQFLLKLRAARLDQAARDGSTRLKHDMVDHGRGATAAVAE
jgi:3-vinyl bacteriochlorophyllide hydratase